MELKLFKKNEVIWTRFKISVKEIKDYPPELILFLQTSSRQTRKSSSYVYFEVEGDYLNRPKKKTRIKEMLNPNK